MKLVSLDEVLDYVQPTKYLVDSTDYNDSYSTPVLTAGKSFLLGHTDEVEGIYNNPPVIIFDDFTTSFHYVDFNFKVKSSALKILKLKNANVNLRYVFYAMSLINFEPEQHKRYWISKYSKFKIPLPPLPIQERIAEILDASDSLRQKDQQLLQKYEQLSQSIFLEMFGGQEGKKVQLSSLLEINPKKSQISELKDIQCSFVPMADVTENGLLILNESRVIRDVWTGYTYFQDGDVVFAKITPCMENGKAAIMKNLTNGIGFGTTEFHVLRPIKGKSIASWVFHLVHSEKFRKLAEKNMTGSAGQKRVPTSFFEKFIVVSPSLKDQIKFEKISQSIEEQKSTIRENLKKSEQLFQSLLQKAFKGELVKEEDLIHF